MTSKIGPQVFAAVSATSIFISGGFQFGWSSPSLPILLDENSDLYVTSDQGSWIVSFMTFGAMFGPFIAFAVVDRWGRKLSLLLTAIPLLLSCFLIAGARNYLWLYLARFIGGFGLGAGYTIAPMYLGEIAEDKIRGALGSLVNTMLSLGIVLTYSIGPFVDRITLPLIAAIAPILFVSTFIWAPESPYFYMMKNKEEQAEKSLVWLMGKSDVKEELEKVAKNVELDLQNRGSFRELFCGIGNRKAMLIIIGLLGAQQLCGVGAILAYSTLIFTASGSTLNSSISVIIAGTVRLFSGVLGVSLVDKIGRRPLLMLSVCFTTLCLVGVALYFQLDALNVNVTAFSWLPFAAIVGFFLSHTFGIGVLPYAVMSEILPCNVKAFATMVSAIWSSGCSMAVSKLYQVVADAYGIHAAFWGFAVFGIFFAFFIYFMVPETKGRSLRDIHDEFLTGKISSGHLEKPMA